MYTHTHIYIHVTYLYMYIYTTLKIYEKKTNTLKRVGWKELKLHEWNKLCINDFVNADTKLFQKISL